MKNFTVLLKSSYNDFSFNGIKRIFKRMFSILLLGIASMTMMLAQTTHTHNIATAHLIIPGTSTDNYIITGTSSEFIVTIQTGYNGTITLKDLNITSSRTSTVYGESNLSCITVEGEYNRSNLDPITKVNVILEGTNSLKYTVGSRGCAFQVNQGAQIHINAIDPNNNISGTLTAENTGNGSAAIGAPYFPSSASNTGQGTSTITCIPGSGSSSNRITTAGGNVIIGSGIVNAKAIAHGAGIGGGWYTYYNGIIIVYGGIVTSTSGMHAAGIGSGCPQGTGVLQCYADNSTIIALPPAQISAQGANGDLAGSRNITYMNDPNRTAITVRTIDNMPNIPVYLDLTETIGLVDIFMQLGLEYEFLKKVRVGITGSDGKLVFRGQFEQTTTFFTDASSNHPSYLGRPYLPVKTTVMGGVNDTKEIVLPYLDTDISFVDYPSTPLEEGYTTAQAEENAHVIKMEYNDSNPMSNVTFALQGGASSNFREMFFLNSDSSSVVQTLPTTLNQGDKYYIVLPIVHGKTIGIYEDVLLITGEWQNEPLPGYIRRVGMQRVVKDDTGQNNHIKVTANPDQFKSYDATTATVDLTLNIDHTGFTVNYDPLDVKAKYIITPHANYNDAVAATPVNNWANLNISVDNATNITTTVPFNGFSEGMYYIHWYVESGVVYAHSQDVSIPPAQYGGFGPYIITTPVVAGALSGNAFVCEGNIPSQIFGEASTGGSGNFTYKWHYSTDQATWTPIASSNNKDYAPTAPLTSSPTYFKRITVDDLYGGETESLPFSITEVPASTTLYWNPNAADNNWNNPANWLSSLNGTPSGMVPLSCTDVFISGTPATKYPSLSDTHTPTNVYGPPVCRNITFAYGAQLAYQHKLQYEKAFVRYNWGYYGTPSVGQPNNIWEGTQKMDRDKWHILASPLKSIATGDFSLAGYPFSWQKKFEARAGNGNVMELDFSGTFATNDVPLVDNNNAIAVKMAGYQNQLGYSQENLEGLNGIIEMPYFENTDVADYFSAHHYDALSKQSYFYYFDTKTLKLINNPLGKMKRANEAYRFVYEDALNEPPNNNIYEMPVQTPLQGSNNEVMVGNPFLAGINASDFSNVNSGKINSSQGYKLLSDNGDTWVQKYFTANDTIPAWKAFIVTLSNSSTSTLSFPLEATLTRATSSNTRSTSTEQTAGNILNMHVLKEGSRSGDHAELRYNFNSNGINIQKMIMPEGHATPEVFFIDPEKATANLIQPFTSNHSEIEIGVKSSDIQSQLSLEFSNIQMFTAISGAKVVLIDKLLGKQQDISRNPVYYFTQHASGLDKQHVDKGRFALQLSYVNGTGEQENAEDGILIEFRSGVLKVTSDENIDAVAIYDLYGRMVSMNHSINLPQYTHPVLLQENVFLVQVKTTSGKLIVKKILGS